MLVRLGEDGLDHDARRKQPAQVFGLRRAPGSLQDLLKHDAGEPQRASGTPGPRRELGRPATRSRGATRPTPACRRASGERLAASGSPHLLEVPVPAGAPKPLGQPALFLARHQLAAARARAHPAPFEGPSACAHERRVCRRGPRWCASYTSSTPGPGNRTKLLLLCDPPGGPVEARTAGSRSQRQRRARCSPRRAATVRPSRSRTVAVTWTSRPPLQRKSRLPSASRRAELP